MEASLSNFVLRATFEYFTTRSEWKHFPREKCGFSWTNSHSSSQFSGRDIWRQGFGSGGYILVTPAEEVAGGHVCSLLFHVSINWFMVRVSRFPRSRDQGQGGEIQETLSFNEEAAIWQWQGCEVMDDSDSPMTKTPSHEPGLTHKGSGRNPGCLLMTFAHRRILIWLSPDCNLYSL